MYGGDRDQDTVCAVSTPHGVGGISVIRISGKKALSIVSEIAAFLPTNPESHKAYFGVLKSKKNNEPIDEVLVTYFQKGKSFTGEEVLEISCHGSPFICQTILNALIQHGARAADRGEFTYRSFMNNKLDLVQAESVLSMIESQSQQSAKLALRQLKGDLSKALEAIENDMTWILAHAEAGIDFSTEGIEVVDNSAVLEKLARIKVSLGELVESYNMGRILKDGFRVVLTGLPNVGKSSLLNLFLQDQRAIVTDIPGTTRDVIHGDTTFDGFKFTFLDTAGLRDSASDLVEQIGIKKSYEAQSEADLVLFVFDSSLGLSPEELTVLNTLNPEKTVILANKADKNAGKNDLHSALEVLKNSKFYQEFQQYGLSWERKFFFVSALDKTSRTTVLRALVQDYGAQQSDNVVLLSNTRHFENLSKALENTASSEVLVQQGAGNEFLAIELKEALIAIHETLGKRFDDQIMDRVFKEFCIGK